MSMLPAFNAILKDTVDKETALGLKAEIQKMEGVLSVNFNRVRNQNAILVTHKSGTTVRQQVSALEGVSKLQNQL